MIYPGDRRLARQHLALGNRARAFEFDPSLRAQEQRRAARALDAAFDSTIERSVRAAVRKATSPKRKPTAMSRSRRFNASALFQREPSRSGEAFAAIVSASKNPLEYWRQKVATATSIARGHAFDSASDHEAALEHLERMARHIDTRGGTAEFDPGYMARCFAAMLEAMGEGAEDEDPLRDDDSTAQERHRAATGEGEGEDEEWEGGGREGGPSLLAGRDRRRARDAMGETPARSVASLTDERRAPDHRNDFRSAKQGGADAALAFDADRLFQRGK